MEFVAFIGEDKKSWGQISALINRLDSEKCVIVKDKNLEGFPENPKVVFVDVDSSEQLRELRDNLMEALKSEISGEFEVAVSIASGNGKENMALLSALLNMPVGVKLVAYTKDGIEFLS